MTLFPIDYYTTNLLTTKLGKEKKNWVFDVAYKDEVDNKQVSLKAIAHSPGELCKRILFKTLKGSH